MLGIPSSPVNDLGEKRRQPADVYWAGLGLRPWYRPAPRARCPPSSVRSASPGCAALRVLQFKRGESLAGRGRQRRRGWFEGVTVLTAPTGRPQVCCPPWTPRRLEEPALDARWLRSPGSPGRWPWDLEKHRLRTIWYPGSRPMETPRGRPPGDRRPQRSRSPSGHNS